MLNEKYKNIENKKLSNNNILSNDKNKNNNPESFSQIRHEIYYFKNEIIKELNKIEQKINSKISLNSLQMNNNKIENDNQFKLLSAKIDSIFEKNLQFETFNEKLEDLIKYKIKNEQTLLINNMKIDGLKQEINNNFSKYDKIIKNHMVTDGLVGNNCQFKTYPEMLRFILDNISKLNTFREKNILDLKSYKVKLESLLITFRTQIDNILKTMTEFTTKSVNEAENRIKGILSIYDERLVELRATNNNYINNLVVKYKELIKEWDVIKEDKKDIYNKIDNDILNLNNSLKNYSSSFNDELDIYNKKYLQLCEEINILKKNIGSTRERQINYSKKISLKKSKKAFDEDFLFIESKGNKRLSVNLENGKIEKWKKYIQNTFNKIIQKNNPDNNDSYTDNIDIRGKKLRNTLSYGGLKFKKSNKILNEENKILNIKEHFDSINEEENEENNYINKNNLKNVNIKNEQNENMDLLSNKTNSDECISDDKDEKINSVIFTKKENNIKFLFK